MPLKLYQRKELPKTFEERTYPQRLGETLHYLLENLIAQKIFKINEKEMENLIKKALSLYPEPLSERNLLEKEAQRILKEILENPSWKNLNFLLKNTKIFTEIEGFLKAKNTFLRPDLIAFGEREIFLMEIKLRKEDYSPEQIELYSLFLQTLFPEKILKIYLITLLPFFEVTLLAEIPPKEVRKKDAEKGLLNTTQLPLFKNLN